MDILTRESIRQGYADGIYHNPGYSLPCPNCGQPTTYFEGGTKWFCYHCWIEFDHSDTELVYDVQAYEQDERMEEDNVGYQETEEAGL